MIGLDVRSNKLLMFNWNSPLAALHLIWITSIELTSNPDWLCEGKVGRSAKRASHRPFFHCSAERKSGFWWSGNWAAIQMWHYNPITLTYDHLHSFNEPTNPGLESRSEIKPYRIHLNIVMNYSNYFRSRLEDDIITILFFSLCWYAVMYNSIHTYIHTYASDIYVYIINRVCLYRL